MFLFFFQIGENRKRLGTPTLGWYKGHVCDTCMEYKHPLIHMYNQVRNDRNIEIQFWLASSTVTCIYQLLFKSKQASQWTYVLRFKLDLIFYLCFLKDKKHFLRRFSLTSQFTFKEIYSIRLKYMYKVFIWNIIEVLSATS